MEEGEVNVAELKVIPPYTCKLIRLSKGKTVGELKCDKFNTKTYTFNVSKCDKIFDVLVAYGQIIVPPGSKNPPFE